MRKDFYQRAYDVVAEKLTEALIILQEENKKHLKNYILLIFILF